MSDIVEAVARAICVAEGIDPDRTSIGFGHRIPKGVEYKLWEAQREKAEAAIAAVGVEIERLRARVEALEQLTRESLNVLTCDDRSDDDPGHYCSDCDGYVDWHGSHRTALRAALEAKP